MCVVRGGRVEQGWKPCSLPISIEAISELSVGLCCTEHNQHSSPDSQRVYMTHTGCCPGIVGFTWELLPNRLVAVGTEISPDQQRECSVHRTMGVAGMTMDCYISSLLLMCLTCAGVASYMAVLIEHLAAIAKASFQELLWIMSCIPGGWSGTCRCVAKTYARVCMCIIDNVSSDAHWRCLG